MALLESGLPVENERRGKIPRIVSVASSGKLARLQPRPFLKTDPEDLVHLDWSQEWRP